MPTKTLKVRVKDKHVARLTAMARSVNLVWNYINELSSRNTLERRRFLSSFDLQKYTAGAAKEIGLHSHTIKAIADEYATRRKQFKKSRLAWRSSGGQRRSLGWVPIKTGASSFREGRVFHNGALFDVWDSFGLGSHQFRTASFNEDARGRWYFNVCVEVDAVPSIGTASVGIDLGCKDAATPSVGAKLEGRNFRKMEHSLAKAQRAKKRKVVKAIHAKIANRRKDEMHKFSRKIVTENAAIFVGNVSSQKMARTSFAKSALDAGWGTLKAMLKYKSDHACIVFGEVNEAYTSQTCSECGCLPASRPRGIAGLGIREWACDDCGTVHDRDVNAARNILRIGLDTLAEGAAQMRSSQQWPNGQGLTPNSVGP